MPDHPAGSLQAAPEVEMTEANKGYGMVVM